MSKQNFEQVMRSLAREIEIQRLKASAQGNQATKTTSSDTNLQN